MGQAELVIAGLLVAVAGLSALARLLSVPYPIVLVIGGAAVRVRARHARGEARPEVVLVVFLPPLLYGAAFFANLTDIRVQPARLDAQLRRAGARTMAAVAVVAHALVPGLPWAAAWVLGAVVSPTDPLAAGDHAAPRAAAADRQRHRERGPVQRRHRAGRVQGGRGGGGGRDFSLATRVCGSCSRSPGGVAIGLAVGWIIAYIRERTTDIQVSVTISLLSGYAAFIPANGVGASGALAAVTPASHGLPRARGSSPPHPAAGAMVWELLDFLSTRRCSCSWGCSCAAWWTISAGTPQATLVGYAAGGRARW